MYNKNIIYFISIIIILLSFLLTVFLPEKDYYHIFYHIFLISVIMLSLFISMKTIFNIIMIFSAIIWALTFFEILNMTYQLLAETFIMILIGFFLGWYEINFKKEKNELNLIISYKRKENEKLQLKINEENRINESLLEEMKKYKKILTE